MISILLTNLPVMNNLETNLPSDENIAGVPGNS
jgi:hypothetical protein